MTVTEVLPGLEVLEFDDFEGSPVDFDFKPLAEIRGRIHAASKNSAEYQNVPRECSAPPACSLSAVVRKQGGRHRDKKTTSPMAKERRWKRSSTKKNMNVTLNGN